jgi:hypothetical protein
MVAQSVRVVKLNPQGWQRRNQQADLTKNRNTGYGTKRNGGKGGDAQPTRPNPAGRQTDGNVKRRPALHFYRTKGNIMKKMIPLIALMFLAGCGKHSTENQSGSANPAANEPAPGAVDTNAPAASGASNSSPANEMVTNGTTTNSSMMGTNGTTGTNQN